MSTLLWIEHDGCSYHPATLSLVKAAANLPKPCVALVVGNQVKEIADTVALIDGIDKVIFADAPYYFPFRAEPIARLIADCAKDFTHICASSSTSSKNIFPRMAAILDSSMLSDVVEIISKNTFIRPIYAGNALAQESFVNGKIIATIRTSAFEKVSLRDSAGDISEIKALADDGRTKVLAQAKRDSETPDLQTAKIVVSGGRGFGDAEKFKMVEQLAHQMDAAVGATRAAVDAGFISNEHQVGQTGKIVAPDLYLAIGISGAIQHLAGMKESKVIVAINKDADAPIFEIATYGLVGDLFTIVPQIMDELKKLTN